MDKSNDEIVDEGEQALENYEAAINQMAAEIASLRAENARLRASNCCLDETNHRYWKNVVQSCKETDWEDYDDWGDCDV